MGRANGTARRKETAKRAARDRVVLENLSLVKAIAIRVHESLPVHVDLDDLVHAGVLGLFDAASKYNPDKKVVFQSYAKHRVKGAILDSLRQLDWASRDLRKRQKQVDAVTQDLMTRLRRHAHRSGDRRNAGPRHRALAARGAGTEEPRLGVGFFPAGRSGQQRPHRVPGRAGFAAGHDLRAAATAARPWQAP